MGVVVERAHSKDVFRVLWRERGGEVEVGGQGYIWKR